MADDDYKSTLIFDSDTKNAEKAFDRIHKGLKQVEDDNRRVAKEAQKASLLYADSMVAASEKATAAAEKHSRRVIELLKRQTFEQQRLSNVSRQSSGGGLGGVRSGVGEVAREVAKGSPIAPVLEGFASLTPAGIAAGVAATGAAAALSLLQQRMEEAREAARKSAEVTIAGITAEQEARFLAERQRFDELQKRADAERDTAMLQADTLNALREEYDRINKGARELVASGEFSSYDALTAELQRIKEDMESLADTTSKAQTRLKAFTDVQDEYSEQIAVAAELAKVNEQLTKSEAELDAARKSHDAVMASLIAQEKALNEAYTKGVLTRSIARSRADARANEDRDLAAERAAEDLADALEAQEKAHQANLQNIVQRGQDAIADVYAQIAERQAQAVKQIADLQRQYDAEQLRAEQMFGIERGRALEDYQREVARAAEDLKIQLRDLRLERDRSKFNAILDNNVLAFLDAQQNFEDARRTTKRDSRIGGRRGREDFERDEQRAAEDFAREQEERRKAHEERLAEIQNELNEFIASSHAKIAQIEAQTAKELELAQAAYNEQLRLDQEQRDKINRRADEDLQRSLDRLRQDREAEDAAARTAHTEALTRIQEQATAQQTALDTLIAKTEELRQKALSLSFGGAGAPPVTVPGSSRAPYVPTPGSEKFYEDPGQGAPGQSGGGGFGSGLNSVSSASGVSRGGSSAPVLQFNSITIDGMEFVSRQDVEAAFVRYHAMMIQELGLQEAGRG